MTTLQLSPTQRQAICNEFTENIYGKKLSKSAVSRITESLYEEMKAFRERLLERHYPLIYLDAAYVKTIRETISSEWHYAINLPIPV